MSKREVSFAENLPKVGSIVKICIAELGHLPFEAMIIGRGAYNYERSIEGSLPSDPVVLEEAVFRLSFAPKDIDDIIAYTKEGWKVCFKEGWKESTVAVEIIG